ncbi:hypothetical protein Mapa_009888 [Marchantia paleacea]|nr:hypothetical protein Mapa_009888 [Marchantia paleacea]
MRLAVTSEQTIAQRETGVDASNHRVVIDDEKEIVAAPRAAIESLLGLLLCLVRHMSWPYSHTCHCFHPVSPDPREGFMKGLRTSRAPSRQFVPRSWSPPSKHFCMSITAFI